MGKIPNSRHRLEDQISRALNKIRKPSTAEEITELLNSELLIIWLLQVPTSRCCARSDEAQDIVVC